MAIDCFVISICCGNGSTLKSDSIIESEWVRSVSSECDDRMTCSAEIVQLSLIIEQSWRPLKFQSLEVRLFWCLMQVILAGNYFFRSPCNLLKLKFFWKSYLKHKYFFSRPYKFINSRTSSDWNSSGLQDCRKVNIVMSDKLILLRYIK